MQLIKKMTAMKATILLCVIAAIVLGYFGFEQHKRVKSLQAALGLDSSDKIIPNTPGLIAQQAVSIQTEASRFTDLTKQLEGDDLRGDGSPQSYIRGVAGQPEIKLGFVKINPRKDHQRAYTDDVYSIVPQAESGNRRNVKSFQRTQLANFMYRLEEGSKRVKVTSFKIETPKPIRPEDYPGDLWAFSCAMTVRSKNETASSRQ